MGEVESGKVRRVLTLTLGGGLFAIDIFSVREILDLVEITRIPEMPGYMRGVVNVRGSAVPVVDLRMKFGMGAVEKSLSARIVIVEIGSGEGGSVMGVLADSVKEVLELDPSSVAPPPSMGTAVKSDFIKGIARREDGFVIILDVDKTLSADEIVGVGKVIEDLRSGDEVR